ncbi:DMT family transporter [Roseivivax marinus]|jgi:drug/metabolite transporter (DMT)-like permease|uniref:DMT family transporter n=1 Tax=Roseivivax marinus TaxID=1379903 RepID=UPI001F03FE67|nr:DMT family transporter [Roseivivax marinus]UMA63982.1 DMT family transporter [Roseivivax marinus]
MRLFLLTALTMVAFAANSVLNRLALASGEIEAGTFGTVRLIAGAVTLGALCLLRDGRLRLGGPGRAVAVAALVVYIYGFSAAYRALDAGLGALILFGTVQVTMFAGALRGGERPPAQKWIGAAVAAAGLVWLLWPGEGPQTSTLHGLAMVAAGAGWGVYSLVGRGAPDPLMGSAANFVLAAPIGLAIGLVLEGGVGAISAFGLVLAVLSGAVTSGLGYALWYTVLPRLQASTAAVAQLSVPAIAIAGGWLVLGEALTAEAALAALIVLGGVALAVLAPRRP